MSWLSNIWGKVFGARTKQTGGFGSSMIADLGANGRPPSRDTATTIETYNSMPIIRSIIDRISSNVATNRWRLFQTPMSSLQRSRPRELKELIHGVEPADRHKTIQRLVDGQELTEIEEHPLLRLMRKPNPMMAGFEFRKVEQVWMDQVGESFTVIDRRGNGEPDALWPIVPWWVQEVPTSMDGEFVIRWRSGDRRVAAKDMIWMRYLNPSNPYGRGTGIAQTLNNELDADEYAAITTSMRMYNNGTPDLLIIAEGMRDKSIETFREEWRKQRWPSFLRQHEPHFTNAKNLKVEKLQESMVDMGIVELRKFLTDLQIQTFGVPPEILGLIESSNRATINSAQFLYACNVLMPRLILWENTLNETIAREYGRTDLLLLFDNPIPEDREFALAVAKTMPGAFSFDDMRGLAEMPQLGTEIAALHPMKTGITLQSFEEGAEIKESKPAPMPQPKPEALDDDEETEEDEDSEDEEEKDFVLEIAEPVEITETKQALDADGFLKLLPEAASK